MQLRTGSHRKRARMCFFHGYLLFFLRFLPLLLLFSCPSSRLLLFFLRPGIVLASLFQPAFAWSCYYLLLAPAAERLAFMLCCAFITSIRLRWW